MTSFRHLRGGPRGRSGRLALGLAVGALVAAAGSLPARAQDATSGSSTLCRLFPLACPGPVPAPPPPLVGPPDEQADAAPPPVKPVAHRRHAKKHASEQDAQ